MRRFIILFIVFFSKAIIAQQSLPLNLIKLPPGFHIAIYAHVPDARSLTLGKDGIVYVGTRESHVYAIIPNTNQTKAKRVLKIASGLDTPNGVAYYDGNLYVAEVGKILRYKHITSHLTDPKSEVVFDKLPRNRHHGWRFIKFSPDGWLYIGIGAPCNVCIRKDPFASIVRIRPNGKDFQIYARGVRNTVGFAWNPLDNKLWFTDNGRDWLGDNLPPDELNYAPQKGMNFGFPYYYGKNVPDPKFGKLKSAKTMTPAAIDLGPHVAALGMIFYHGDMFPKKYHNQIFIAEHGSWNRSKKIGYRITWVCLQDNQPISYQPFVTGWLQDQSDWGRPVDLLEMPDGALLVSDDKAGVIYRISYKK